MYDTVIIPRVEYERLCTMEEELTDIRTALAAAAGSPATPKNFTGACGRPAY